jgi:hypothetical protein
MIKEKEKNGRHFTTHRRLVLISEIQRLKLSARSDAAQENDFLQDFSLSLLSLDVFMLV